MYQIPTLPLSCNLETKTVLQQLKVDHSEYSKAKGFDTIESINQMI